jgi:uncharacterized membrane protein
MAGHLYMDARLAPTRSLSRGGFAWLMGLLIGFNLVVGSVMVLALHAFPVPIFLGLDVLGVGLAFRASYRGGGQAQRVRVTAEEVRVMHELGASARTVWVSPTAFTRVEVEAPDAHEARVRLAVSGRAIVIAQALSPAERVRVATELQAAIAAARAERW